MPDGLYTTATSVVLIEDVEVEVLGLDRRRRSAAGTRIGHAVAGAELA